MNIKKLIFSGIIGLFVVTSCQKVINIDLKDSTPQYVIEGQVNKGESVHIISITKSSLFSANNTFPTVSGALVIINDNLGERDTLSEFEPGKYKTENLVAYEGRTYTLTVQVDGKTFTSSSTMPKQVNLDYILFIPDSFNEGAYTPIPIRQDPAGIQNNYLFDLYLKRSGETAWIRDSALMVGDDVFSDGVTTQQPLFGQLGNFRPNDSLMITLKCIDRSVYKYFFSLSLNGPNGSATPANPVSNISGGALGYFSAQTKQTEKVEVQP